MNQFNLKRLAAFFTLFLLSFNFLFAQGTATCGSTIYDSGGLNGNYSDNELITTTVFPDNPGENVRFVFNYFETEDIFDTLTVYNGDTTAAAVFGVFSGDVISPSITSTHPTGALTFVFESDISVNYGGYEILVSCQQISEGQYVSVDQSAYTVEQLVEDVLINSSCAEISNILYSTGTNYGSSNGIGYFSGNNSTFPFAEGLILSTGDALLAEGPETFVQNDFNNPSEISWPGDQDLINAVPNHVNSNDATFIQFDFTPRASAISFNFIFASEEYGQYQCDYTDAFAFLLTNNQTGLTTNLALVPGSADPISVFSVRNNAFNSSCPSANEEFFASYYGVGGLNPLDSPINFIGYTVSMEAQSQVIPNSSYSIKLVIADSQDSYLNAAVFLEAGSFDLGGNLGDDITIQSGNALCNGGAITLDSQSPEANHIWYYNGVEITSESSSTIDITQEGTYSVDIIYGADCSASDSILIEYKPLPQIYNSIDLVNCDSAASIFDLTENDTLILGSQNPNEFNISYHLSIQDAENDLNPIINNLTNFPTSDPNTTIYIRVEDAITETCFVTESFNLIKSGPAAPTGDTEQTFCDLATVADLTATGENIQWYDTATGGNLLDSSIALTDSQVVYSSQTIDGCESTDRLAVTILIQDNQITASASEVCAGVSVDLTLSSGLTAGTTACTSAELLANLQNGLVGYWPFCANANDESGNGNNGVTSNVTLADDRFGNSNSAYLFSESTQSMITINPSSSLNIIDDISFSAWFYPNDTSIGYIIDRDQCGFSNDWGLQWIDSQVKMRTQSNEDEIVSGPLEINNWYHIIVTRESGVFSMYINSEITRQGNNFDYNFTNTNLPIRFGDQSCTDPQPNFDGIIDDIAIWNRALSETEIQQLVNSSTYIWSTGDTTANISVTPTETTEYWVDVTTNGVTCREYVTVLIQDTDPPLADSASLPQLTAQCELTALTPPTATDNCDGAITGVTTTTLPITASTTITWTYTDLAGNSSTQTQDVVIQDTDPPILNTEVSSEPFADTHVIVAAAIGIGVYEFSLDNGPWQASGTFIGVSPGEHIVSVRDVNCFGEDSYPLMVLDYPPFFTPNGDGYNDFWNIDILSGQPTSKIYIFDRYGKLLKQIRPSGSGWNGTYNGKIMPTSDYWFLLEYSDFISGAPKMLRGHFTLKR